MAKNPLFPKPPGAGYRRPVEGSDVNLGNGHFEARVRQPANLGSGLTPRGDKPVPLWTQFLSPKEYTWIYDEVVVAIATSDLNQQVTSIDVPSTSCLVILEWTPLLLRPKAGAPTLLEMPEPIEYGELIVASLLIGGKSPIASAISFTQSSATINVPATRFMNRKAFCQDPTFPIVAYGSGGEGATVNFYYGVAANSGNLPGSTDLNVGSIITGLVMPSSSLDRIFEYMRLT